MCYCPTDQTERARAQGPPALAAAEVSPRDGSPMIQADQPPPTSRSPTRTATPSRSRRLRGKHGRPLLLSEGRHAGLHDAGLRRARPPARLRRRPAPSCSASRPTRSRRVKKFHDKQALNFTLLADEDHAVCEAYGVWVEKSMYGKNVLGRPARDVRHRRGRRRRATSSRRSSPKTHDEEVLAAL